MTPFPDHFSARATGYAKYRPRYPAELFAWLAASAPDRRRAWDCATGSGQAAVGLLVHFQEVIASDPSVPQLVAGHRNRTTHYAAMTGEDSALASASVSAVTLAQALHWLDAPRFFREARRVLVPGGVVAVWSYGLLQVNPAVDTVIARLHHDTLRDYWPAERALVETGYAGVELPFAELTPPPLQMEARWSLEHLLGYLGTWSGVVRLIAATGVDPLAEVGETLRKVWDPEESTKLIRWPLTIRAGSPDA